MLPWYRHSLRTHSCSNRPLRAVWIWGSKMNFSRRLAGSGLACLILMFSSFAWATDCDTDCHDRCRQCLLGACVVEPTCHLQCEVEKKAACAINTPIPHIPSPSEIPNNLATSCAAPFEQFVHATIAYCANWGGRADDLYLIGEARDALVDAGYFDIGEFDGVDIRWCPINGSGMVPERNRVLLHPDLKSNPLDLAATLGHEMIHIRQYRHWGPDDFKCRYSGELISGKGQGRANYIEREAYEFEDEIRSALNIDDLDRGGNNGFPSAGYPSGYGMKVCGCWGPNPPPTEYEPACASGRVRVNVCRGLCAPGHPLYAYVCL